jgi:hypothetical protein
MNLIFVTQAEGLRVFWNLMKHLAEKTPLERVGFSVADRYFFDRTAKREFPEIDSGRYPLVKEWEITESAKTAALDLPRIADYEKKLGDPTLWNALVADRRVYLGKHCRYRQDYRPRYSHEPMLKILQCGLEAVEAHFRQVRPQAVLALNAVTFADYLYYIFAAYLKIPYLQLRLTRVENFVSLFTEPFGLSRHIRSEMARCRDALDRNAEAEIAELSQARTFYDSLQNKTLSYEGAIRTDPKGRKLMPRLNPAKVGHYVRAWLAYRFSPAYRDSHFPGLITPVLQRRFAAPLRAWAVARRLRRRYFPVEALSGLDFAFYPMHTEPEVALSVFGRPYLNQIETIRNIALNLPVGWKLVVKDHPNSWGFHSARYYEKILAIPNVVLLPARVGSDRVLPHARLAVIVNGTIGFEAIVKRIPLITLGASPYGVFPESMVRHVRSLHDLGGEVRALIESYRYDEKPVLAYLAAHMRRSVRVNLFTGLLQKGGRREVDLDRSVEEQYAVLADYALRRIQEETEPPAPGEPSA